ncbi:hypothetical protein MH144_30010 [Paenibacillus sp. ACRRY]|nr:hypothetical protein [Paenibacillus sp. ACRRY]
MGGGCLAFFSVTERLFLVYRGGGGLYKREKCSDVGTYWRIQTHHFCAVADCNSQSDLTVFTITDMDANPIHVL